jgi:hypothetical protein
MAGLLRLICGVFDGAAAGLDVLAETFHRVAAGNDTGRQEDEESEGEFLESHAGTFAL